MHELNPLERKFLLDWFVYVMPQEQRQRLMREHPILYNKLVGGEIMHVHQHNVGECNRCAESPNMQFFAKKDSK
jgi:hypothetical protein